MSLQRTMRRKYGLALTALSASLLAGGGVTARAQGTSPRSEDPVVSEAVLKDVNLVGAPLSVALNLIRQQTHIDLVLKQGQYDRVNVSISQKPVSDALRLVAASAGADLWYENGVYFIGPKGSAPQPSVPQPITPSVINEAPGQKPLKYEKFYLKYTPPHRMLRMLGLAGYNPLDPSDAAEVAANRAFMEGLYPKPYFGQASGNNNISVLPNGPTAAPNPQVPTAPSVGPAAPTNTNGNLPSNPNTSPSGNLSGSDPSGDQSAHRSGGDFQTFGRGQGPLGGGFGQPGGFGQGGQGQGGQGQGGQPTGTGQAAGFLQGISPQDIFALDADNSLVLRYDDPQQILNLQEVLRVLDVKPRQIQIKSEFVTVTQNDVSSFGLNFNFTKVNLLAGANIGYQTANTAFLQYATGNLQTQLSFILTQGRGKVVASPLATTLNGVPAIFISQQNIPVIISGAVLTANGQSAVTTQIVPIQVAVQLQVTPRINGDDSITLTGIVTFGDVTGTITNPAGGTIPITITQPVVINRIVRNGDSMVIAGLTRKRDNVSTNKVPLLGDLPLIGTLFRSRNVTTDDSELVVFITPTIIPDRPAGGTAGSGVGSAVGGPGGGGGLPPVGGGLMP